MHSRFSTTDDLRKALVGIRPDDAGKFISDNAGEIAHLTKGGIYVEYDIGDDGTEIYSCSGCGHAIPRDKIFQTYCEGCNSPLDCCNDDEEPCDRCEEAVGSLVMELHEEVNGDFSYCTWRQGMHDRVQSEGIVRYPVLF